MMGKISSHGCDESQWRMEIFDPLELRNPLTE